MQSDYCNRIGLIEDSIDPVMSPCQAKQMTFFEWSPSRSRGRSGREASRFPFIFSRLHSAGNTRLRIVLLISALPVKSLKDVTEGEGPVEALPPSLLDLMDH